VVASRRMVRASGPGQFFGEAISERQFRVMCEFLTNPSGRGGLEDWHVEKKHSTRTSRSLASGAGASVLSDYYRLPLQLQ